jgi:hypothetical protein
MPFEKLLPKGTGNGRSSILPNKVAASCYGKDKRALVFTFHESLLKKLGWKINDRVCIFEGTGTDEGSLCFEKSDAGWKLSLYKTKDFSGATIKTTPDKLKHYTITGEYRLTHLETQAFGGRCIVLNPDWIKSK